MRQRRMFEFVGELPHGDWRFILVKIERAKDVIVLTDMTGRNPPRIIHDGKLLEVEA